MEIEEAIERMLKSEAIQRSVISVPLYEAYGMVSAEDVLSTINVPSFPKSAMDGYAVCAADVVNASKDSPVSLKVIGELFAGDNMNYSKLQNSAIRVMTGSFIPEGYDSVVMQENTDYGTDTVNIYAPVKEYENYCHIGENIKAGDVLIHKGKIIDEIRAGIASSAGIGTLKVMKPISVTIIATGSEISEPGEVLENGKIYDSISYMLIGKIKKAGIPFNIFLDYTIVSDDENAIMSETENRLGMYDLIITTGGVSVGKKDLIKDILNKLSANIITKDVNVQPGTPTIVSEIGGKIILSLSGNPYAALTNFDLYFYPLLAKVMGCTGYIKEVKEAELMTPYNKVNKKRRLVRAYYEDGKVYINENTHSSSVISNLTNCNCYIDIKKESVVKVGDMVSVMLF